MPGGLHQPSYKPVELTGKNVQNARNQQRSVFEMAFKVSTRLDDINFDEKFDTELEALERAKAWTKASLGEVIITHEGKTYTLSEFELGFASAAMDATK
jgi:hypothetical protein